MILKSVVSGNVSKVGYDKKEKQLVVEFKGGGLYEYKNVLPLIHTSLMKAKSVGSFLNKNVINGGYDYKKMDPIKFEKDNKKLNKTARDLVESMLKVGEKTALTEEELNDLGISNAMMQKWKQISKKKVVKKKKPLLKDIMKKKRKKITINKTAAAGMTGTMIKKKIAKKKPVRKKTGTRKKSTQYSGKGI